MGNKMSQNKVHRNIFANNKRQYKRKRTVWSCFECSGRNDRIRAEQARSEEVPKTQAEKDAEFREAIPGLIFIFVVVVAIMVWMQ